MQNLEGVTILVIFWLTTISLKLLAKNERIDIFYYFVKVLFFETIIIDIIAETIIILQNLLSFGPPFSSFERNWEWKKKISQCFDEIFLLIKMLERTGKFALHDQNSNICVDSQDKLLIKKKLSFVSWSRLKEKRFLFSDL